MTSSTPVGTISKMGKHLKETFGDGHPSAAIKCCRFQFMNLQIWAPRYALKPAVVPYLFFLVYSLWPLTSSKPVISYGLSTFFPSTMCSSPHNNLHQSKKEREKEKLKEDFQALVRKPERHV